MKIATLNRATSRLYFAEAFVSVGVDSSKIAAFEVEKWLTPA